MSQMKRYILIIFTVIILVGVVFWWLASRSYTPADRITKELEIDRTLVTSTPTEGSIIFPSVQSPQQKISARNFLADSDVVDWDGGTTFMLGAGTIDEEEVYQLFYYAPDQSISIVLLREPFADIRLVAEDQLKNRLGVDESALCAMNIRVNIPQFASDVWSGANLGLSFCPGSVQF
jgi:hypothetical protein